MQAENKFKCPCHGSQYNAEGKVVRGPAPLVSPCAECTVCRIHGVAVIAWPSLLCTCAQQPAVSAACTVRDVVFACAAAAPPAMDARSEMPWGLSPQQRTSRAHPTTVPTTLGHPLLATDARPAPTRCFPTPAVPGPGPRDHQRQRCRDLLPLDRDRLPHWRGSLVEVSASPWHESLLSLSDRRRATPRL